MTVIGACRNKRINRSRNQRPNLLLWLCVIWQARIAELEEELEAERAGRTKASDSRFYSVCYRPVII